MNLFDSTTVTLSVTGIEIVALEKLSLVSHALACKIGGEAAREQLTLARTLDDVLRRIKLAASGHTSAISPTELKGEA